ncbi:uncharacterized protein [Littorina saxatilis]
MECLRVEMLTGLLLVLWSVTCVWSATVHIYVSPSGSDSNDGRSSSQPVKTLHHAVTMLGGRDIQGNSVFVELMQGYHDLSSTLHIQSTSGTVVFRAYQGQEVHVTGGRRLDSGLFRPVQEDAVRQTLPQAARTKVLEFDLAAHGVTDLGNLTKFGFQISWTAPLEVFINGKALRLAEWPNNNFININKVTTRSGRWFFYDAGGRDIHWARETEPWAYGYFYYSYCDLAEPIELVNTGAHMIALKEHPQYGINVGHYDPSKRTPGGQAGFVDQGGYFRVVNMLCELDQPGEYYVDRTRQMLYLWPNTHDHTLKSSDIVYASMIDNCFEIDSQAKHVHFEDFSLEGCRHNGFELNDARNVTLKNLEIKNTGGNAVHCTGDCRSVSVLASDIHDVNGGVFLTGGNRTTLVPSQNVIRDNHIWNHARVGAEPNHAVKIGGVHATVSHNHLHHGQYTGIWWSGNDHVIEYNDVHHMCLVGTDCGALHTDLDWTWRGNVIRHNHIHDTRRLFPGASVRGIMLDDQYSSVLIEHNVFYNNGIHANIGGGRDNVIRYNVMYNSDSDAIQVDGRGLSWGNNDWLTRKLEKSPYRSALWKSRYPQLYSMLDNSPKAPVGNQIYSNVIYNRPGKREVIYTTNNMQRSDYFNVHDNYKAFHVSEFWSPDNADFRLHCEAAQWGSRTHFPQPVTVDEVGPTVLTGPHYLRAQRHAPTTHPSPTPMSCERTTKAPATSTPGVSYLPDGTAPNHLYPDIPKEGCWLITESCPSHPSSQGKHKDDLGTQNGTEEGCLARAAQQWKWCGSPGYHQVVAVYGPTGAMTFSKKGCYFATWGCGHQAPGFLRDSYAESKLNATRVEANCLSRAAGQWAWCGHSPQRPYTSVFGPTGAFRTAGAGCWVKVRSCPAHRDLEGYFFDAWGATNRDTGTEKEECFQRAGDYWAQCGSHSNAPVTAYFRPDGSSHTAP